MNSKPAVDFVKTEPVNSAPAESETMVPGIRSRRGWRWIAIGIGACLLLGWIGSELSMTGIKVGDPAPQFTAKNQRGETIRLADYLGKKVVVLYFYPKDNTAICTAEACSFRDAYVDFTQAGAEVIGVSSDSDESHQTFAAQQRLPFQLLSDADGALRKSFGVPRTFGLIPGRVTYVIDKQGVVRMVFNSQFSSSGHVAEALKIVRDLQ